MTDKPDYMQKAYDAASSHESFVKALARTLEALDTERAAHEATKADREDLRIKWAEEGQRADKAEAELQALRIHPGINESAATIRTLLAEREAAHAKGWNEAIEAGVKACGAEQLGDPQDEADAAYDRGVEHCVAAILALAKP